MEQDVMMQTVRQQDSSPRLGLSLWVKIMYGVGEMANAIKTMTFGLYSMFFVTVVIGLPGVWVGIIGFAAVLWDAVIDPGIGFLTDRPGSHSRRYLFMLVGASTMGVGYWAFFNPMRDLSDAEMFGWLLAASLILRSSNSMYMVPYYALGASLSQDYHERTAITAIRGIMNTIGTAVAAALSFVLFFPEKVAGVDPKLQHAGYASMGVIFGVAMTIVALIGTLGTLPMHARDGNVAALIRQPRLGFIRTTWKALQNRAFRALILSCSCVVAAMTFNGVLLLHYLTYYVDIKESTALSGTQIAIFGGGLIGTLLWMRVLRRFDKHLMYMFSAATTAILMMCGWLLFGEGHLFGTGDVRPLLVGYCLTGFLSCILWFVPASMLADVADESELHTGGRTEGSLFGMFSFFLQVALGVGVVLAGFVLDHFVVLIPGNAEQSSLTVYRIGLASGVVPAIFFVSAAILMRSYHLTRSRVESIQVELRRRRGMAEIAKVG